MSARIGGRVSRTLLLVSQRKGARVSAEVLAQRAAEFAALVAEPRADTAALLERAERLGELHRLLEGVGVELAGELETFVGQHPDGARSLGEKSPSMVLQACAGFDAGEAAAMCKVGAAIRPQTNLQGEMLPPRHEALASAVAEGGIRITRAARVLVTLDEIAMFASSAECAAVEQFLIELAPGLTDRQFTRVCREMPGRFVPDGAGEREEYLRRRSGLVVRTLPDGLVQWIVTMHPEAAGLATAALDARTAPRRQPTFADPDEPAVDADTRPMREKRLDSFVSICREAVAGDSGKVAGSAVTMMVTTTLEALRTGLGTAKISGIDEPISAATARRLAADANIIPVVLGSESECLDMGREVRLATEPQRRALALRDQCIWGTCSVPAGWCEVAHIVPWFDGGGTDLDNLMLLCPSTTDASTSKGGRSSSAAARGT
jgi:5-methylcytosine-specific restriction protein A